MLTHSWQQLMHLTLLKLEGTPDLATCAWSQAEQEQSSLFAVFCFFYQAMDGCRKSNNEEGQ